MNAQNGQFTLTRAFGAAALAACMVAGSAPAFGQLGARSNVERRLGLQRGGAEPTSPGPAGLPEDTDPQEDMRRIVGAKTVEELMEIGRTLALSQKLDLAAIAVERIVAREPALLEDSQKQTPKSWNDFWFTHRAKLREKKLAAQDAAGRARIAVWLYEAGMGGPARAMLKAAMAIDKDEPTVKELAEKWHVFGGGPVQFDLTCGLKEPLIVETIQDENVVVSPRAKDRVFLILPIAYQADEKRLLINKSDIRVTGEDGRPYSVTGLALLERTDRIGGAGAQGRDPLPDRGRAPEVKMPAGSEPLWEQMIVQPAQTQALPGLGQEPGHEVVVRNIIPPFVRPVPGQRGGAAPRDRSARRPTQESKPSTGYAAFIVEIPQTLKTLECSYKKGELQMTLDMEFLLALSRPVENLPAPERDRLFSAMAGQVMAKSAPVASAALRKLNAMRLFAGRGQHMGDAALKPGPVVEQVEKTLLAALAHEHPQVRRDAFDLLNQDSSEELVGLVADTTDENLLAHLVAEVEGYFRELREALAAIEEAQEASGSSPQRSVAAQPTPTGLAALPGRQGVRRLLTGCLRCGQAPVREKALAVILSNPFEETVGALEFAGEEAVGQLLTQAPRIEEVKVKQAVLAVLMKRPSGRQLPGILKTFSDAPVVVSGEDDPILEIAMREDQPAEVQQLVLETLARADLSAVAGSDRIRKLIEFLASGETRPDVKVRAAMIKLAMSQLKTGYEAPVKRSNRSGRYAGPSGAVGFDSLLAAVAVAPATDAQTARQAAAALLGLGRVRELLEKLKGAQEAETRVQDWIQHLARDKSLSAREALPVFVANQLASTDPRTLQLAVTALSAIQKSSDPKQRWKANLAIKQGLEAKQLVTLTAHAEETISRPALALLRDLGGMTMAEAAEFEGLPDEASRQGMLGSLEQNRSSKAVGTLACMVYVDVRGDPGFADGQRSGRAAPEWKRDNVPLTSSMVTFQRSAGNGQVRVLADGLMIGPPERRQGERPSASPGSIAINASTLLRAALNSPEAQAEGLAGKINPASLRGSIVCELKYEQLGTWGGEVTIQDTGGSASNEFPLKVVGAKILLEPMTQ